MQGRNGDADVEKKPADTRGRRGGMSQENHWRTHTTMCKADGQWESALKHMEPSSGLCNDPDKWAVGSREAQVEGARWRRYS